MKRLLMLCLLVLLALSIASCDEREDSGLPSLIEALLDPQEDFYLILEYDKDSNRDDSDAYCSLITKRRLEELWINSQRVLPEYMSYSNYTDRYHYILDMDYLSGALPSDYNEEVVYQLKLEGKTISGSLIMPAEYILNPPDFVPAQNYGLVWTLADDPKAQVIDMSLQDINYNYYDYYFTLKPADRAYTFNKSLWSEYQPLEDFEINLEAHNYLRTKGGIIWFISSYRHEQYSWNRKSAHQQRIEKLLKGENPVPGGFTY